MNGSWILKFCFVVILGGAWVMPSEAASVYAIDQAHSSIGFSIAHMMISKTTGGFNAFDALIDFDANDLQHSRMDFTIQVSSIDTKNEARDKHLKNTDFFQVEQYPLITFKTKKIVDKGNGAYGVTGDLTMKAVTKEIEIPVTVSGPVIHPMRGGRALGIEANFKLNRQDYGVSWNKTLDNGGLLIGNDVAVSVSIEAHQK